MPLTNSRQSAAWQARFNRAVIEILGPTLAERGYHVSLDQVTEDVEPDSYGPFYVGEVAFTRPLPNGQFAHVIVQATTQAGRPVHTAYVDLLRGPAPDPPNWLTGGLEVSGGTGSAGGSGRWVSRRLGRPAEGPPTAPAAPSPRQGWEFREPADLRNTLISLRDYLVRATPRSPQSRDGVAAEPEQSDGQPSESWLDWLEGQDLPRPHSGGAVEGGSAR